MKIIIITQNIPLYIPELVNSLMKLIEESTHTVSNIIVLSRISSLKFFIKELKMRLYYYGLAGFFRMAVLVIVNKIGSLLFNVRVQGKCYSISNVIRKYDVGKHQVDSVNSQDFINYLRSNDIDIILSIASPEIFSSELLSAPKKGCINYHLSFLPDYRGRAPIFWALLNNEKYLGVSVHEMDEKIDNGPIIVQEMVNVGVNDTLHSMHLKVNKIGTRLMMEAISRIAKNNNERIVNKESSVVYWNFPEKKDVKLFRSRGKSVL